jgi:gliding motility-associated-like protein
MTFGYFYFFFGDIYPRYVTRPELDTCYDKPIQFIDSSIYAMDSFYNTIQLAKWYWSFGDGETSNLRFPAAHQFPKPGEYTVKFTVSNSAGCTFDTLVHIVHLGSIPTVDFDIEGPACVNSPLFFKDESISQVGEPTAFTWTFPGGLTSIYRNPTTTLSTSGSSVISLRVRTFYGCEAEKTKAIEIGEKPNVDFNYTKDCQGIVSFVPTELNNAKIIQWHWLFGDGSASISMQPIHNYKETKFAVASLIVQSNTGCVSDTVSKNIFLNRVYPFAGNDTVLAIGESLQLHATGGDHYQWDPPTGLSNPDIADPVVQINHAQLYIVHISNNDGCVASDSIMIKVYKGPEIYLPSGFTPNHDGRNDSFKPIGPGIQSLEYFRIYNRSGNLLFETKNLNIGWDGSFDGRVQPAGTYVWMLTAVDLHGTKIFRKGTVVLVR